MLSRPTTDQLLRGIADDLRTLIAPELQSEQAKVALAMITQLLAGCAVRAAHEIAWMSDESDIIERAVADIDDRATRTALTDYRATPKSLELAGAAVRYGRASRALSAGIEYAYRTRNEALAAELRSVLKARSAHEMAIMGQLDLVGRG